MEVLKNLIRNEKFIVGVLGVVSTTTLTVPFVANSMMLKKYASSYAKKLENEKPTPIPDKLDRLFYRVLTDLQIGDRERIFYKLFLTNTMDLFVGGSSKSSYGTYVGLPEYFGANNKEELIKSEFVVDGKPVKWDTKEGEALMEALLMSDKACKYAMAKLILMRDGYYFQLKSFLPAACIVSFYGLCSKVKDKWNLSAKRLAIPSVIYLGIATAFYGIWYFVDEGYTLQYDKNSEDKVLELGEGYVLGGLEYYTKTLERNRILREIKTDGPKYYTPEGNDLKLATPLTFKKRYIEMFLDEFQQKEAFTKIPVVDTSKLDNVC